MRPACGLRVADHAFDERGPLAHNTQCHADRLVERSFLLLGQRLGRVAVPHLTTKPQWRFLDLRKHSSTRWAGDRHRSGDFGNRRASTWTPESNVDFVFKCSRCLNLRPRGLLCQHREKWSEFVRWRSVIDVARLQRTKWHVWRLCIRWVLNDCDTPALPDSGQTRGPVV